MTENQNNVTFTILFSFSCLMTSYSGEDWWRHDWQTSETSRCDAVCKGFPGVNSPFQKRVFLPGPPFLCQSSGSRARRRLFRKTPFTPRDSLVQYSLLPVAVLHSSQPAVWAVGDFFQNKSGGNFENETPCTIIDGHLGLLYASVTSGYNNQPSVQQWW